jgi:hypothetical protein
MKIFKEPTVRFGGRFVQSLSFKPVLISEPEGIGVPVLLDRP